MAGKPKKKDDERVKVLEAALRFYASPAHYQVDDGVSGRQSFGQRSGAPPPRSQVDSDGGALAREALEG